MVVVVVVNYYVSVISNMATSMQLRGRRRPANVMSFLAVAGLISSLLMPPPARSNVNISVKLRQHLHETKQDLVMQAWHPMLNSKRTNAFLPSLTTTVTEISVAKMEETAMMSTIWTSTPKMKTKRSRSRKLARAKNNTRMQMASAGSTLPDCSHACGSCSPCKRVIVSYSCRIIPQSQPCPLAYKCMCNGKSYPIP